MDFKQVIVVRNDLKLSKGKLAAQASHASVSAMLKSKLKDPWLREGQKKVVLKVASQEELFEIYEDAKSMGLPTALIRDMGLTEIPPNTVTCIGIGPEKEEVLDRVTGHLKML